MVRKTREQVWRELDNLGEDEVRRRLEAKPTEVEEPGLIHEWLTQRERVNSALADTSDQLAARHPGVSKGVKRAIGSAALIGVAAVALAFLLAQAEAVTARPGIRQAMLKPAFAHLYPGIPANEWQPAAVMMDQVLSMRLRKQSQVPLTRDRALDELHFEFRGVASSGMSDAVREARHQERKDERRRRQDEGE